MWVISSFIGVHHIKGTRHTLLDCQGLNMRGEGGISQGLRENVSDIPLGNDSFNSDRAALNLFEDIKVLGAKMLVPFGNTFI